MKTIRRPLLPDCLYQFVKNPDLIKRKDVVLFGDDGRKYIVGNIYNETYQKKINEPLSYNSYQAYQIPLTYRPFCTCRKSKWIVCTDKNGNIFLIYPGDNHRNISFKIVTLRINAEELANMLEDKEQTNFLPQNKQKHVFAVAEYMYRHAKKYNLNPEEMYVLGLLHDIGYLYGSYGHGINGSAIMKSVGFLYADEIRYHGKYQQEYDSPALQLLNEADMQIDAEGNFVGYEKRLNDIGKRYGFNSENYKYSKELIKNLKQLAAKEENK